MTIYRQFNLNDQIRVKLNKFGLSLVKGMRHPPSVDPEGYVSGQGWSVLGAFGSYIGKRSEEPFSMYIEIEDTTPKDHPSKPQSRLNEPGVYDAMRREHRERFLAEQEVRVVLNVNVRQHPKHRLLGR